MSKLDQDSVSVEVLEGDDGATVVQVGTEGGARHLRVNVNDGTVVDTDPGNGSVTRTLTRVDVAALEDVFESAARGREDFRYLASLGRGDYTPSDVDEARKCHAGEEAVEREIRQQLERQVLLQ